MELQIDIALRIEDVTLTSQHHNIIDCYAQENKEITNLTS